MTQLVSTLAVWVSVVAFGALAWAGQVPLRSEQVPFRSQVDVVEVDVAVRRGGATVAGLTAANFVVTDNDVGLRQRASLIAGSGLVNGSRRWWIGCPPARHLPHTSWPRRRPLSQGMGEPSDLVRELLESMARALE